MDTDELTYGSYLRVPELLSLQRPRSRPPHPEELHFIVVHQALELWMKLLLHDLGRIVGLLDGDDFPRALALLGRVNHTLEHALADAHAAAAARRGITDISGWADLYMDPGSRAGFYLVCETLVDYDERFT